MKKIELTKGKVALVDDEDFDELSKYCWHAKNYNGKFYAARTLSVSENINRGTLLMHRQIMKAKDNVHVDHKDHNGLNNVRDNLRLCTPSQNMKNRHGWGKSEFKGVSYHKATEKFRATICVNKKCIHLGLFDDELSAANRYNLEAIKIHGEFANLNTL